MTAAAEPRRPASRQTAMKSLAGGLGFVCLVLFLLAIEQKQAVEAWRAIRDVAVPAAGRAVEWTTKRVTGEVKGGLSGLTNAIEDDGGASSAADADRVLTGTFGPADPVTRETVGSVSFIGATVRFESGDSLKTEPLRIADGREAFAPGQTFAARFDARADAQIELRRIVPASRTGPVAASPLCAGRTPGTIAVLHRQDRVDLMLFQGGAVVGPDAQAADVCGVWSFRAR